MATRLLLVALAAGAAAAAAAGHDVGAPQQQPNIVMLLMDDYGWANAGWHNNATTAGQREVRTPHMNQLIAEGIELNQHYVFKFCSCVLN